MNLIYLIKKKRKRIWEFYYKNLKESSLSLPKNNFKEEIRHALHLFSIGLPKHIDRDEFVWKAGNEFGITFGVHYNAIPTFSAYKNFFPKESHSLYPNAIDWGNSTISLSLSAAVSDLECERIVECIKYFLK